MDKLKIRNKKSKRKLMLFAGMLAALALVAGSVFGVRYYYHENLKPVSQSAQSQTIEIETGSTLNTISQQLHDKGLINSRWVFERYVRSQNAEDKLLAGTYSLSPSQTVPEIVNILTQGLVAADLITILPEKTINEIRSALILSGFDEEAVDDALDPSHYEDHPALVDKPRNASLAGYLYPESFHKDSRTTPESVVRQSLNEMAKRLTPEVRRAIVKQGLTVHEGIILASIVEGEVNNLEDKKLVAQVFYKRLAEDHRLESDAAKQPEHNTYEVKGLPPVPLTNVNELSIQAVAYPADTDYFFFVTGEDCITRFAHTLSEHEENIERYSTNRTRICD